MCLWYVQAIPTTLQPDLDATWVPRPQQLRLHLTAQCPPCGPLPLTLPFAQMRMQEEDALAYQQVRTSSYNPLFRVQGAV